MFRNFIILHLTALSLVMSLQAQDIADPEKYWSPGEIENWLHDSGNKADAIYTLHRRATLESDSLPYAHQLLDIAEEISVNHEDSLHFVTIYGMKARLALENGDYIKATEYFNTGLSHFKSDEESSLTGQSWFLVEMGNFLYKLEFFKQAAELYVRAYFKFQELDDPYGKSVVLNNLGLLATTEGNYNKALNYFQKSFETRQRYVQDSLLSGHSLLYLIETHYSLGNHDKVDSLSQVAEEYLSKNKTTDQLKEVLAQQGAAYLAINKLDKAERYLKEAQEVERGVYGRFLEMDIYRDLGKVALQKGDTARAENYFLKGLGRARRDSLLIPMRNFLSHLAQLYAATPKVDQHDEAVQELHQVYQQIQERNNHIIQALLSQTRSISDISRSIDRLEQKNTEQEQIISYQRWGMALIALILSGIIIIAIVFYRMVGRLKRQHRVLQSYRMRSKAIANSIDTPLISLDKKGYTLFYNQAGEEYFAKFEGLQLKLQQPLLEGLKGMASMDFWRERIERSYEKSSWQEVVTQLHGEEEYHFIYSFTQITIEDRYEGLAVVITDFTDKFQQNRKIAEKSKKLEETLAAKNQILSLLAHDLKEGVSSNFELTKHIVDAPDDFEKDELLNIATLMNRSLSKTQTLLHKTLDWLKSQTDNFELQNKDFPMANLTRDVIQEVQDQANEKQVSLVMGVNEGLRISADPHLVRTVMRNLLQNAIKFSPADTGKIEIYCKAHGEEKVEIHVKDNGVGMDHIRIEKLMSKRSVQSEPGTNHEKGSGLGLQLCQDLLALQGSSLQVLSEKGHGSDFYFVLPKVDAK